jgi:cell division protein FtsB
MGRTTSTQRGASRRTASTTASRGGSVRRSPGAGRASTAKRGAKASPRKAPRSPRKDLRPAGPWLPFAVVALVLVLGWSLYPAMKLQYQTARRAQGFEEQYASLQARKAALSGEVAALKTPQGVEKAARENLGYAKKGENVYVVLPDKSTASTSAATASMTGTAGPSIVQTVLDAVFGVTATVPAGARP